MTTSPVTRLQEANSQEILDGSRTTRVRARDVQPGDVVRFGDIHKTVAAVATQVATFYNPGMGIPHGCMSLYWEGDPESYPVGANHELEVTRADAIRGTK